MNTQQPKDCQISRRDFLKLAGLGAGATVLGACGIIPTSPSAPAAGVTVSTPGVTPTPASPALAVDLTAARATVPILSGAETPVWRYQAVVREGAAEALVRMAPYFAAAARGDDP